MCNRIKKSAKTSKMWDKACLFVSKSWLKSKSEKKSKNRDIYFLSISHSPTREALKLGHQILLPKNYSDFIAFSVNLCSCVAQW